MATLQANKTFKDIEAEYDELYKVHGVRDEDRAYHWHAKTVLKNASKINSVLDIACGGGYFLREISRLTQGEVKTSGCDISSEALRLAKKESPESTYSMSVAEDMPYQNDSFDAITCLGSMEHFLDINRALGEMKRIVKQEGLVYIMVPNLFWYKDIFAVMFTGDKKERNQTQERFATLEEWRDVIEQGGLKVEKVIKYNGIAKSDLKQKIKDLVIPRNFSYHFVYICRK